MQNSDAAMSLVRDLFVNNFTRCLKVTKEDIKDTFESLEKRLKNDIAVEPCIKDMVFAFHCWVKTCFWLNADPEQILFPKDDASAILKKSEVHDQFIADASDNETTCKPESFTEDDKWDKWAKTSKNCLGPMPGSMGIPSSHVICNDKQPQPLSQATDKANFVSMARLARKTFEADSKKVHTCLRPSLAKHTDALSVVEAVGTNTKCGQSGILRNRANARTRARASSNFCI